MPTLSVSYVNNKLVITGGDNNGADITISYGLNNAIVWNRVGTNFKFLDLTLNPVDPSFTNKVVTDGSISIIDNDSNTTGRSINYEYTLTYALTNGTVKTFDPKVINKAGSSSAMLVPMARKAVPKAKRTTRARK